MCQICSKTFDNADSLSKHRFEYHSETFKCKICQEVFYSNAGLTRHENKAHPTHSIKDESLSNWNSHWIVHVNSTYSLEHGITLIEVH